MTCTIGTGPLRKALAPQLSLIARSREVLSPRFVTSSLGCELNISGKRLKRAVGAGRSGLPFPSKV